jgi:site-specific DNA recombinase
MKLMDNKNEQKFFIYCRKSSESEDRQAASIEDQMNAIQRVVDSRKLNVVGVFTEEKSSKSPGRPVFNEMISRINAGEANALCVWDNDRLARNPIDNGTIAWMLQTGVLKVIMTPGRSYFPDDAGLLLSIEQGRATDYVIRLSKNVKRGLNSKAAKGWRPCGGPIGYINVGIEKGNKTIDKDPDRFDIVRRMWDHYLTGQYSVRELCELVNEQWGLRTPQRRKLGGKKLSMSHMYRILNDVFYTGKFEWIDPETDERRLYDGKHPAMITEQEYRRAQVLLGAKGKPQPKTKEFAYTGLAKCGECDSSISAEEKNQIICTCCKYKFSYNNRTNCPKCATEISDMQEPTILHYVYYRCSKKKGPCSQKYVRLEEVDEQVLALLDDVFIDERYIDVVLDYLKDTKNVEYQDQRKILESLKTAHKQTEDRLTRLNNEYNSAANVDYSVYTTEEFKNLKQEYNQELERLFSEITDAEKRINDAFQMAANTLRFCGQVKQKFENGNDKTKRVILSSLGSNLKITDQTLSISLLHPFQLIVDEKKDEPELWQWFEPGFELGNKRKTSTFVPVCPTLLRR